MKELIESISQLHPVAQVIACIGLPAAISVGLWQLGLLMRGR